MIKHLSLIGTLLLLGGCGAEDEASILRRIVTEGAEYAQQHDIASLMAYAAVDFKGQPGDLNAKAVKGILFRSFKYYGNFRIYHPRPFVDLDPSRKTAKVTVYFVILRKDYLLPDLRALYEDPQGWVAAISRKADLYELELTCSKTRTAWKVAEARIQALKGSPS